MSPTMSTSSPNSECFDSIVPESDNDPLSSPPSPSSLTLSPVLPLHDVKESDSNKEIKVDQNYNYLPQDYTLSDYDQCAHIRIESSSRKQLLVQIDGTMYILDPAPINPIYRCNPLAKYVHKIIWIAEHLPKAMSKVCPGSRWNENILLWHQKILDDIPVYNRELSGYIVPMFMSTWEDDRPHFPFLKDGYELRKLILGQLLTLRTMNVKITCLPVYLNSSVVSGKSNVNRDVRAISGKKGASLLAGISGGSFSYLENERASHNSVSSLQYSWL